MQDRQDSAVGYRIQKFVRVPAGRERPGLRFAVADHARDDEIRVVERGAVSMRQRVAELAAFVDRPRRFRRGVTRDAARERELFEQPPQPVRVFRHVRVVLAVRAFEVRVRDHRRAAVPRAADVDHVQVVLVDDAVQVRIDEVQSGRRAPVPEQAWLDVLDRQRLRQQRVIEQVDLSHRQVVGGAPVRVETHEVVGSEGRVGFGVRFHNSTTQSAALSSRQQRVDVDPGRDASVGTTAAPQTARHDAHAQTREHVVTHGA